ncbi:MAG: MFS transporter [Ardenticatenales bacterium]|nr:MFS transporter [Ardenticatenales bacterium]
MTGEIPTEIPTEIPADDLEDLAPAFRRDDWRVLLGVYWITSFIEAATFSQVLAFLPSYLTQMGVSEAERLRFVGLFGALVFVVGAPLVPLWGVWADKYSRKAVIIRSALVEAVVFTAIALSRTPTQLALSMLLIGLQLGNTGVMLAAIRDVTPHRRLGTAIALFGASGAVGFAAGPAFGGWLIDGRGLSISFMFAVSAVLSLGAAALLAVGSREIRPAVVPQGSAVGLAVQALRSVLSEPTTRRIFTLFGVAALATQMTRPYVPVLVERLAGQGPGLASAIALVVGTAALAGALVSPLGGAIGDRIGFRPVLIGALLGSAAAVAGMPLATTVGGLALLALGLAACQAAVSAMVFGMIATEVPPERRSATINLVYLPLYAAGIIGPALGAAVVAWGVGGVFGVGAGVLGVGVVVLGWRGAGARGRSGVATLS